MKCTILTPPPQKKMTRAYVCMKISEYPPPLPPGSGMYVFFFLQPLIAYNAELILSVAHRNKHLLNLHEYCLEIWML